MFDVGLSELMLIGVVALVVLGPERLPRAARMAGALLRRMRTSLSALQQDLEREVHAEELKRSLRSAEAAVASYEPNQAVKDAIAELEARGVTSSQVGAAAVGSDESAGAKADAPEAAQGPSG